MVDRVGQQLGNYRLTRLLGRGGFAEVYLGEHFRLKSRAAIKVLHAQLSEDDITGFLSEAQTIAKLEHPNIVHVLDFDIAESTPFLVMGYASEGTLRQRHPKGAQLMPKLILPYVKQIADALHYAHSEKLIHRDVKPENMLLGRHNQVLLSDFGIALIMQSSHYQSLLNTAGTISYMAPEQIQGKPRPASDQYALGIVIYEWLTGSRPFQGSFTEIATQHVLSPPSPLREKIPDISPALERVVLKALAKDPHQRFADMQEFAYAFEQACQTPFLASPTMLLNQPLTATNSPAPLSPPALSQNPGTLSKMTPQSLNPAPSPVQPPQSFSPIASPALPRQPSSTPTPSNIPQRQKWHFSLRTVLISVICLILVGGIAIGLLTGGIQSLFAGGQTTLTGSIVSVNASTGTVVMSVNGQQDTIKNVPANVIQSLQSQGLVGKVYTIQVTPNSDGTFSIVSGSNVVLANNEGTPTINNTATVSSSNRQTPTTIIEPGSIIFFGTVQSVGSNSMVVTMPTGGTLSFTINSSTDLGDFNNNLAAVGVGTLVNAQVVANADGSFTATKVSNGNGGNSVNQAMFTGVTTAAVGSDRVIHFTVGNKSFSFPIASATDLSAFNGNIPSGATVSVTVQFSGSTGTAIAVS
jgi:serine/threonine protein kinase